MENRVNRVKTVIETPTHHPLPIFFFLTPLFGKGEETGVLFERRVNGKFGWYKGGDEKKDWKYVGEIKKWKTKWSWNVN